MGKYCLLVVRKMITHSMMLNVGKTSCQKNSSWRSFVLLQYTYIFLSSSFKNTCKDQFYCIEQDQIDGKQAMIKNTMDKGPLEDRDETRR